MTDFYETEPGQVIAGAHRYLSAAKELRYSETWTERPTLLHTPTIHLICHGIELLLKYPLLAAGATSEAVRKQYGHNLLKLWNDDANPVLRQLILDRAPEAWEEARASTQWPEDDFDKDPGAELELALDQLGFLHSGNSGFALRYIAPPETRAPRPAFLIDVFGYVAERGVVNPTLLTERW